MPAKDKTVSKTHCSGFASLFNCHVAKWHSQQLSAASTDSLWNLHFYKFRLARARTCSKPRRSDDLPSVDTHPLSTANAAHMAQPRQVKHMAYSLTDYSVAAHDMSEASAVLVQC